MIFDMKTYSIIYFCFADDYLVPSYGCKISMACINYWTKSEKRELKPREN